MEAMFSYCSKSSLGDGYNIITYHIIIFIIRQPVKAAILVRLRITFKTNGELEIQVDNLSY